MFFPIKFRFSFTWRILAFSEEHDVFVSADVFKARLHQLSVFVDCFFDALCNAASTSTRSVHRLPLVNKPYVEMIAVMAKYNPLAEKAGMKKSWKASRTQRSLKP